MRDGNHLPLQALGTDARLWMFPPRALSPANSCLLLDYRPNKLERRFNAFDMKRSSSVDVIDSYTPTPRIVQVMQADLFPKSENEPLIVGSQRRSSSDPLTKRKRVL
jgi:hypothetical protein